MLSCHNKFLNVIASKLVFLIFEGMKNLLLFLFIPFICFGQEFELPALRLSNNFSKPNRVLKTTISDESLFKQNYNNTDLTLDYVIRYHFYTSIDLNSWIRQGLYYSI